MRNFINSALFLSADHLNPTHPISPSSTVTYNTHPTFCLSLICRVAILLSLQPSVRILCETHCYCNAASISPSESSYFLHRRPLSAPSAHTQMLESYFFPTDSITVSTIRCLILIPSPRRIILPIIVRVQLLLCLPSQRTRNPCAKISSAPLRRVTVMSFFEGQGVNWSQHRRQQSWDQSQNGSHNGLSHPRRKSEQLVLTVRQEASHLNETTTQPLGRSSKVSTLGKTNKAIRRWASVPSIGLGGLHFADQWADWK